MSQNQGNGGEQKLNYQIGKFRITYMGIPISESHEEIKGFMDAMTMGYKVSPLSLLKAVKPGDSVQFTIDTEKRVITKIAKTPPRK